MCLANPTAGRRRSCTRGSVLGVTLFLAFLFGFFLFSYLSLARHQRNLVARAQGWNAALGMAEAGVEEALAQLNPGVAVTFIDRTANGWGVASGGLYGPKSRSLSNGSYSVVYTTDTFPTIYSTGYVSVASIPAHLARVLQVMTTNVALFSAAMACRSNINLNGNSIYIDSFNSSNTNLSTNGRYDPNKASTNGTVASIFGIVNVANADIMGALLLGPTASGFVGPNGLVSGGIRNDFNVEFEDVVLPQTSFLPVSAAPPVSIDGVGYQYVFALSGDYQISALSGNVYVSSNTVVRLKLTGNASPGTIRVAGMGSNAGKLTIFMDGNTFSLSGNTVADGGCAGNLLYYGTTNNTKISFSGNASFTAAIYAPEAAFSLGGGGATAYDFVGACFANNVNMIGHFNFHFDEALLTTGPVKGFLAASWKEL